MNQNPSNEQVIGTLTEKVIEAALRNVCYSHFHEKVVEFEIPVPLTSESDCQANFILNTKVTGLEYKGQNCFDMTETGPVLTPYGKEVLNELSALL